MRTTATWLIVLSTIFVAPIIRAQPYLGPVPGGSRFGPGITAGMAPIPGITTPGRTPNTTVDIPGLEPVSPAPPAVLGETGAPGVGQRRSREVSPPTGEEQRSVGERGAENP